MMRYDIDAKQRIQDQLQLKYTDECFVLTASYIETFVHEAFHRLMGMAGMHHDEEGNSEHEHMK